MASYVEVLLCLLFVTMENSSVEGCGGIYTSLSGVIQSPNYPNDYINNLNCTYLITAPVGYRITLSITHLDLEHSSLGCFDYIRIADGDSSSSSQFTPMCNQTGTTVLRTFGNQMWINLVTDNSITRSGFTATYSSAIVDDAFFLIVKGALNGAIFRMDVETLSNYAILFSDRPINPRAVDYDPVQQKIYWTQINTNENIRVSNLNGTDVETFRGDAANRASPEGLAVDPLSRLLFYSDTQFDVIGMMSLSTKAHKTIISDQLDDPKAIVLDTKNGVIFWTAWGSQPKIERANYDGGSRTTLVDTHLQYVNALALDVPGNKLYWVDGGMDRVESVNLNGQGRSRLLQMSSGFYFFGMALYQDSLYITNWGASTDPSRIIRVPVEEPFTPLPYALHPERLHDIHVFHQHPSETGGNGCGNNNGGCSVFCIPLPSNNSKCMCPDSFNLTSNLRTCIPSEPSSSTPSLDTQTISASSAMPFDTDGSQLLTLTCNLPNDKVVVSYNWSVECSRQTGNTCSFSPQPSVHDGKIIRCTATFDDGEETVRELVMQLNYPPTSLPAVDGYTKNQVLQSGQKFAMTCIVEGGKPPVSSVIFSCPGLRPEPETQTIIGQSRVQTLLIIDRLNSEDNGQKCVCAAEWKDTDFYRLSTTVTLVVEGVETTAAISPTPTITAAPFNVVPVAAGAAAGVAVIVIIIIIVVIIIHRRRSKDDNYSHPGRPQQSAAENQYTNLGKASDKPFVVNQNVNYNYANTREEDAESAVYLELDGLSEAPPAPCGNTNYISPVLEPVPDYHFR